MSYLFPSIPLYVPFSTFHGSQFLFFSIINALMEHCGDETAAVLQCYGGDESAVMTCTNCAWEQLLASGVGCDGLEEEVEADYSACADVCKTECDNDVITLKSCGIPLFCDEEPTLEIA